MHICVTQIRNVEFLKIKVIEINYSHCSLQFLNIGFTFENISGCCHLYVAVLHSLRYLRCYGSGGAGAVFEMFILIYVYF